MMTILSQFYKKAKEFSNKVVFITDNRGDLTFKEVDEISTSIANQIIQEFNDIQYVPIWSKSDEDYVLCLIACFKANKIYVPINNDTPSERIIAFLNEINTNKVLVRNERLFLSDFSNDKLEVTEINESYGEKNGCPELKNDIAYLLSTSGTTGMPKFVQVTHKNLDWFLQTMNNLIPFKCEDIFLVSTAPQFDVCFHEMLSFIYGGGKLRFISGDTAIEKNKNIRKYLLNENITHLSLSPSGANLLMNVMKDKFQNVKLKFLLLAGESLPVSVAKRIKSMLKNISLFNLYGPTEATVYATYFKIDKFLYDKIPIGNALNDTHIILVDEDGNISNSGEIFISGEGVSNGYLNKENLNAERFPVIDGTRYFRTGDYAYIKDSLIFFEGRIDDQVQINGIRVELGEVEENIRKIISKYASVKVLYIERNLVLFTDTEVEFEYLYKELSNVLPSYMIPRIIINIEEMKLTKSNKTDVNYLIKQYKKKFENISEEKKEDSDETLERKVIRIIDAELEANVESSTNLLEIPNFDSLKQIELIVSLEEEFNIDLNPNFFRENYTVERVIQAVEIDKTARIGHIIENGKINEEIILKSDEIIKNEIIRYNQNTKLNNLMLIQNDFHENESYYIQKAYVIDNFNQILKCNIDLSAKYLFEDIQKAVNVLIETHALLRSVLNETMNLKTYNAFDFQLYKSDYPFDMNFESLIIEDLSSSIYNKLLWRVYYTPEFNCLQFYFNHLIADQSSLNLFKDHFYMILRGEKVRQNSDYNDFIKYINENSKIETLKYIHSLGFDRIQEFNFFSKEYTKRLKYFSVKCKYKNHEDCVIFGNYIISKLLCLSHDKHDISGSTIMNIRLFDGLDITDVFGDVHSTIPLVLNKEDDYETFKRKFSIILKCFEKGDNVNNTLYRNYPEIESYMKEYEFSLDDNLKFSGNFLGGLKESEIDKTINELVAQQISLQEFSKAKLYISFFKYKDSLIFIPITKGLLSLDEIENLGGEINI